MEVICLEEAAFYELIETVIERMQQKNTAVPAQWLNTDEAMSFLNIKSKTTMQQLRDSGKIRYSQPQKRIILYDRKSLETYLEQNANETF